MSTDVATRQPRSILASMAVRYGMESAAFEATVRATCMPDGKAQSVTREDFAAFLLVAHEHNLNPLVREIFAYPKRGGGIQPIVSVDGWIKKVNEHPQFDGMEFKEELDDHKKLFSCTCTIWRKDRSRPTVVTEYLSECIRSTEPWKMANRMLRHKALIQCARVAFGFAGIMDPDEAEKIIDITPAANAPARPTRADFANATAATTTASYPLVTIIDEFGEVAGEWPAPRAIAMLGGLVRGKDHDVVIAVVEHNQEALAQMEQAGIAVGEIEDLYKAAVAAKQADVAKADEPATGEPQPAGFWQQEILTIDPKPLGWNKWVDEILMRQSEAASIPDLDALATFSVDHIEALDAKSKPLAKKVRDGFTECRAALALGGEA